MSTERLTAAAFDEPTRPTEQWPPFPPRPSPADRAADPGLAREDQMALAGSRSSAVRAALAANGAVHPDVQVILAEDPDCLMIMAGNPALCEALQARMLRLGRGALTGRLAAHGRLSPPLQQVLAASPRHRASLARNPRLLPQVYDLLAAADDIAVTLGLARNPGVGAAVLAAVARDPSAQVRRTAAGNPTLAAADQMRMARDPDPYVLLSLALNPALEPQVQVALAAGSRPLAMALAENPGLTGWSADLLLESLPDSRYALAGNPSLGLRHQRALARDACPDVRERLAGNPGLHPQVQAGLGRDGEPGVNRALAQRQDLLPELAVRLAGTGRGMLYAVLMGPKPQRAVVRMALDILVSGDFLWPDDCPPRVPALGPANYWRKGSLDHPVFGPMIALLSGRAALLDAAVGHADPLVRWGLLANDRLGPQRLAALVDDEQEVIRIAARRLLLAGLAA